MPKTLRFWNKSGEVVEVNEDHPNLAVYKQRWPLTKPPKKAKEDPPPKKDPADKGNKPTPSDSGKTPEGSEPAQGDLTVL